MNTFERWHENNCDNLSDNAVGLFRDSLRCFKKHHSSGILIGLSRDVANPQG